jgi:hypothetical protein
MTQRDFVIVYVGVPLVVALAWLIWRARFFILNAFLYGLAVVALLALVRLGDLAWQGWDIPRHWPIALRPDAFCADRLALPAPGDADACWT